MSLALKLLPPQLVAIENIMLSVNLSVQIVRIQIEL